MQVSVRLAFAATLAALAPAQDDLRDRVVLVDGGEVRGRVVTPFAPDEVLLVRGGERIRVARGRIQAIHTITLDVATLLDERLDAKRNPRFHWMLADWARSKGLDAMARLQAYETILLDPDHAAAHAWLGHRPHPRHGFVRPVGSRWMNAEQWAEHHATMGRPLELESEHFVVRTSAGLRTAIDTLVDLERLYVFVLAEYGEGLQLREAIEKLRIDVWSAAERFPALSSEAAIPYFEPRPFADRGHTRLLVEGTRPEDLFTVATQALLYRCLADDAPVPEQMARLCPWAELGFARHVQSRLHGAPGAAVARDPGLESWELALAQSFRTYRLTTLTRLNLRDHFYGSFGNSEGVHWASTHAFAQFLLDPAVDKERPGRFLAYLRTALRDAQGDSSSTFDRVFGLEIETLEGPFLSWLARQRAR
jgi:hypothetical protein